MADETPEHLVLHCTLGGSDKIYQADLEPKAGGFVVNFAYGRRGATLTTGTKTPQPLPHTKAKALFDKLVNEKRGKGYVVMTDPGSVQQHTSADQRQTDILPQLLNEIDEAELPRLIDDPQWIAQEKFDGRRLLVRCEAEAVTGINRRGLTLGLPNEISAAVLAVSRQASFSGCHPKYEKRSFVLDGESVGNVFHAFDMLQLDDEDLRPRPYATRLGLLQGIIDVGKSAAITAVRCAETAHTPAEKQALLAALRRDNREGIVFKRKAAPYTAGRPNTGGDQRKFKFTATASCLVAKVNAGKRSVALRLYNDGVRHGLDVGNVTIPPNFEVPPSGTIVEVRYLYAYRGGALYQPVYLGPRDDVDASACVLSQLKYKAEVNTHHAEDEE